MAKHKHEVEHEAEVEPPAIPEFDGRLTCVFEAGNGFTCAFEFELRNVIGQMGISRMNEESFSSAIGKALTDMLGSNGVVKK